MHPQSPDTMGTNTAHKSVSIAHISSSPAKLLLLVVTVLGVGCCDDNIGHSSVQCCHLTIPPPTHLQPDNNNIRGLVRKVGLVIVSKGSAIVSLAESADLYHTQCCPACVTFTERAEISLGKMLLAAAIAAHMLLT